MILGSVFLDAAVMRHDRTILRDKQCVVPEDRNKDIRNSVAFLKQKSFKISSDGEV